MALPLFGDPQLLDWDLSFLYCGIPLDTKLRTEQDIALYLSRGTRLSRHALVLGPLTQKDSISAAHQPLLLSTGPHALEFLFC